MQNDLNCRTVDRLRTLITGLTAAATLLSLGACSTPHPLASSAAHLGQHPAQAVPRADIPGIVTHSFPRLPEYRDARRTPTFNVAVDSVPTRELLSALAQDAGMDIEFSGRFEQLISLQAKNQTLPQLLKRIARLGDLRIEIDEHNIRVSPDHPYLRLYPLDYVNIQRQMSASIATTTQIAGQQGSAQGTTQATPSASEASGNLRIDNRTRHQFWEMLEKNIRDLLRETDKVLPEGSSETIVEQESQLHGLLPGSSAGRPRPRERLPAGMPHPPASQTGPGLTPYAQQQSGNTVVRKSTFQEAGLVILNPESGLISVRATQRQHEKVQEFLDRALGAARRQVMIEATIVEVELSEGYKHGIDWSRLRADGSGFSVTRPSDGSLSDSSGAAFGLVFKQLGTPLNLVAAIDLLQSFGTTKVLSSPRLSVLNNQPAVLKVVDNVTYFSVKSDTTVSANVGTTTAVTTTPQSVSVGLVMAVTPQISDLGSVILNVRPTISSVSDWKQDPNPTNIVANFVPQIRTREIESVMRIEDGDIAVLGGLMEDRVAYHTGRLPLLGELPLAGELLTKRNNQSRKS